MNAPGPHIPNPDTTDDTQPDATPGDDKPRRRTSRTAVRVFLAMCWGLALASPAALATWSGKYYVPMPWWPVLVLAAGLTGIASGWALGGMSLFRNPWLYSSTCVVLVFTAAALAVAGQPADIGFAPDPWAGVRDYRSGCLAGTEYTDEAAQLSITTDTVIIVGSQGGVLRFTRTEDGWPSPVRAEIFGRGVVPRDRATRLALTATGCD